MYYKISNRSKQKGAALLAFAIIFIVASSYALVTKLNANAHNYSRQGSNLTVLNEAKAALIGYAVNYPLNNPGRGPGHLPCPDLDNDGDSDSPCALAGPVNFTIGRLPYRSTLLNLSDLRDSAGERLWYAVADNYRSNVTPGPNSDTAGNFFVDGNNDIVAVIFAPGPPFPNQNRSAAPLAVANYLEDDNANGDVNFVTRSANNFNDTLVTITRQELMSAVEKRVMGDVDEALRDYQTTENAFPWLSNFTDPAVSIFRGTLNTRQGHIPFHWSNDPDSIQQGGAVAGRNPFSTNISVIWENIVNATTNVNNIFNGWNGIVMITLSEACLNDIDDCDEGGIFPEMASLSSPGNINCTWTDRETADCESFSFSTTVAYVNDPDECPAGGTITRTYTINFPAFSGTVAVNNPDAVNIRTRNVSFEAVDPVFLPGQNTAIQIEDRLTGVVFVPNWPGCGWGNNLLIATGTSTFDPDTEGDIAVNNIQYDIDVDDGELPEWFVENGWHDLIYVAYPAAEALPGGAAACTPGVDCLTVNVDGTANTNVRATVLSAGNTLAGQDRLVAPDADDYFDNVENTDANETFLKSRITNTYNDQTRIISTAP